MADSRSSPTPKWAKGAPILVSRARYIPEPFRLTLGDHIMRVELEIIGARALYHISLAMMTL
jgi:hypothetical protein